MKHFTQFIPLDLAEKLKAAGMPIANVVDSITGEKSCRYTYAHIFDWLMDRGVDMELSTRAFFLVWDKDGGPLAIKGKTWHEAAEAAIEKALTLI